MRPVIADVSARTPGGPTAQARGRVPQVRPRRASISPGLTIRIERVRAGLISQREVREEHQGRNVLALRRIRHGLNRIF